MFKKLLFSIILSVIFLTNNAQEKTSFTFKDTRIVNGQSIETNQKGQLKFIISHRFGSLDEGVNNFFGLDQATIRLGLDYGVCDWFTVGIGRSSFEKTVDGFAKAKLMQQTTDNKVPFSITAFGSIATRTLDFPDSERENYFSSRLFYTGQLLLAKKFSDAFSLQLMPTFVHRNLVPTKDVENDVIAFGAASRYQLTKTISFQTEYYFVLPDQIPDNFSNSLSLGFDIETKGHVFQLHVSNSQGMIEKFFIGETRGKWEDRIVYFGFNISRDFQLTGRKYK